MVHFCFDWISDFLWVFQLFSYYKNKSFVGWSAAGFIISTFNRCQFWQTIWPNLSGRKVALGFRKRHRTDGAIALYFLLGTADKTFMIVASAYLLEAEGKPITGFLSGWWALLQLSLGMMTKTRFMLNWAGGEQEGSACCWKVGFINNLVFAILFLVAFTVYWILYSFTIVSTWPSGTSFDADFIRSTLLGGVFVATVPMHLYLMAQRGVLRIFKHCVGKSVRCCCRCCCCGKDPPKDAWYMLETISSWWDESQQETGVAEEDFGESGEGVKVRRNEESVKSREDAGTRNGANDAKELLAIVEDDLGRQQHVVRMEPRPVEGH